jgi:O-glycosyl hydrolase
MSHQHKIAAAILFAATFALAAFAVSSFRAKAAGGLITVDIAERRQPIEGWEVTLRGWETNKLENRYDPSFLDSIDEVLHELVDVAGVNRVRLQIRSGNERRMDDWAKFVSGEYSYSEFESVLYANDNDNKDPFVADPSGFQWSDVDFHVEHFVQPMQKMLAARGEKLFVNLCVVDFAKGDLGSLDLSANPEEYAELVATAFDHLKEKYGLTPDSLEIILEPENSGTWQAERIGPAIRAAKKRLKSKGYEPQIIAPSSKLAKHALYYFDKIDRAGADVDVIAYHSYDRPPNEVRDAIARAAKKAGVRTAMLEHLRADVNEFHADMTVANVSAWQQWGVAHLRDGGNYLLLGEPSKPKGARVSLASRTRFLAQIWRHARIGDVRVEAGSDDATLKPLAFVKPDGRAVLSVIADAARTFSVNGMPPGTYRAEFTTAGALAKDGGMIDIGADGRAELSIPAKGVITIAPAK